MFGLLLYPKSYFTNPLMNLYNFKKAQNKLLILKSLKEWQILSNLLPKSDPNSLKYKWFTSISSPQSPEWNKEEDDELIQILRFIFDEGILFI